MAFGLLSVIAALGLLAGAVGVTFAALEPDSSHRSLLMVAMALMGLMGLLAAGIGWLGLDHGLRTLYVPLDRPL